jgi:hypothetical protein
VEDRTCRRRSGVRTDVNELCQDQNARRVFQDASEDDATSVLEHPAKVDVCELLFEDEDDEGEVDETESDDERVEHCKDEDDRRDEEVIR